MRFYVYVYYHDGAAIYVGKGTRARARDHLTIARRGANGRFYNLLRRLHAQGIEPLIEIVSAGLSSDDALTIERALIQRFGRRGIDAAGTLYNISQGGDDPPNHAGRSFPNRKSPTTKGTTAGPWSAERRAAHSERMLAVMADPEKRARIAVGKRGRPGPTMSAEARSKIGAAHRGRSSIAKSASKLGAANPMFGRRWFNDGARHSLFVPGTEPAGWLPGKKKAA